MVAICIVWTCEVRIYGEVQFSNTEVFELLADPFVKFGTSVPTVRSIIMYEHFKETRLFEGVSDWMAQRARKSDRNDTGPDEKWYLLEKIRPHLDAAVFDTVRR